MDGILGSQARVDGVSGTWLDLTNNVNGMANSLTISCWFTEEEILFE